MSDCAQVEGLKGDVEVLNDREVEASEKMKSIEKDVSHGSDASVQNLVDQMFEARLKESDQSQVALTQDNEKYAEQIELLFKSKADKDPIESTLLEKAEARHVQEIDDMLRQFGDELKNARHMTQKEMSALKQKIEKRLKEKIQSAPGESVATTKCLFTGDPASLSTCLADQKLASAHGPQYDPHTARYNLPKLGQSKGGDVFRGGFRMPLDSMKDGRAGARLDEIQTKRTGPSRRLQTRMTGTQQVSHRCCSGV